MTKTIHSGSSYIEYVVDRNSLHIDYIFVERGCRCQGMGSKLINSLKILYPEYTITVHPAPLDPDARPEEITEEEIEESLFDPEKYEALRQRYLANRRCDPWTRIYRFYTKNGFRFTQFGEMCFTPKL